MDKINSIDALILSGGLGSRLRSEVGSTQKTMAEVGGHPFLDIIINHLKTQGIRRIILCTGYNASDVESYYRDNNLGVKIEFSTEKEKLGTGGAIKNAATLIGSDVFFVMNGDSFCPMDFVKFLDFHMAQKALASIAVSQVQEVEDYGSILIDEKTKEIFLFGEKLQANDSAIKDNPPLVNNGIYCFDKKILAQMPQMKSFSLEKDFFPGLVGKEFYGFQVSDNFIDIGTPERYKEAKERYRNE